MLYLFQFDGISKFAIENETTGQIQTTAAFDFEEMSASGRTYYVLNIQVEVGRGACVIT
jgi:hypothetical protein